MLVCYLPECIKNRMKVAAIIKIWVKIIHEGRDKQRHLAPQIPYYISTPGWKNLAFNQKIGFDRFFKF